MIVLDASVLISHLEAGHTHAERTRVVLDTAEDLIIHPITLAECLVGPARQGNGEAFRGAISQIGVVTWRPDDEQPYRLAQLRASTGLRLPDCCVIDTAIQLRASLASFGARLAKTAGDLGLVVHGLTA
ncbi:MAG: PIN domain-containing protein [Micrococcales bacterium]|nr:PIN domain-containing protein [Micrococcales bacterium]